MLLLSILVLAACNSSNESKEEPEEVIEKTTETVVTGEEIEELVKAGELKEVKRLLDEGPLESDIDVEVVKSYLTFLESTELMSLRTGQLMDSVDYGYSGILSNEIESAIYSPHEENSLITGTFENRTGFDKLDWKYNDKKDAYERASHWRDLVIGVEVEEMINEKLIENAKGKNPRLGMTKAEVEASLWGKPIDINRTVTQYSTREQWVYGNGQYLYFTDGILTSFQD